MAWGKGAAWCNAGLRILHLPADSYWESFSRVYEQLEGDPGKMASSGFTGEKPCTLRLTLLPMWPELRMQHLSVYAQSPILILRPICRILIVQRLSFLAAVALLSLACASEGTAIQLYGFNWSWKQAGAHPVLKEEVRRPCAQP